MHRCDNGQCNRYFSKTLDDTGTLNCYCGGTFQVDKNYHPDYGGPGINGTPNPFGATSAVAAALKTAP